MMLGIKPSSLLTVTDWSLTSEALSDPFTPREPLPGPWDGRPTHFPRTHVWGPTQSSLLPGFIFLKAKHPFPGLGEGSSWCQCVFLEATALGGAPPATCSPGTRRNDCSPGDVTWAPRPGLDADREGGPGRLGEKTLPRPTRATCPGRPGPQELRDVPCEAAGPASCLAIAGSVPRSTGRPGPAPAAGSTVLACVCARPRRPHARVHASARTPDADTRPASAGQAGGARVPVAGMSPCQCWTHVSF